MSATYNTALTTNKDKVRFLIQDTDMTAALLQDEEITFMLTEYPNYRMAAANCADVISSKMSSAAQERSIGNLKLVYADKAKKYADLANRLRMQASKFVLPYAGGISEADKQLAEDDEDRVKPAFKRDLMNHKLPPLDLADDDDSD